MQEMLLPSGCAAFVLRPHFYKKSSVKNQANNDSVSYVKSLWVNVNIGQLETKQRSMHIPAGGNIVDVRSYGLCNSGIVTDLLDLDKELVRCDEDIFICNTHHKSLALV